MSSRSRTLIALLAGAIFGFCGALTSGVLAERSSEPSHAAPRATLPWEEASLFAEVYARIKEKALQAVRGTVQADILKEDQAQNNRIFSTEFALRMMGDVQS